jgi:hypothetical protein
MRSLVGERGPEMFVPNQPGTVVPLPRPDPRRDLSGLRGMMEGVDNYINWGQQPNAPTNLPGSLAPMLPIPTDEQLRSWIHSPQQPGRSADIKDYIATPEGYATNRAQMEPDFETLFRINPTAWERFLREQTPSTKVEWRPGLSEKEQKRLRWEEYMKRYQRDPNRA